MQSLHVRREFSGVPGLHFLSLLLQPPEEVADGGGGGGGEPVWVCTPARTPPWLCDLSR